MNNYAARPMLNRFVVDPENTVREMVELAVTNWLGSQRFGTNDHYREELAILAEWFLESAKEMEECWTIASMCGRVNSIGSNRIAADTWGTIYPKLLPPLQIAGKDDGPIQHQHTVADLLKAIDRTTRGL